MERIKRNNVKYIIKPDEKIVVGIVDDRKKVPGVIDELVDRFPQKYSDMIWFGFQKLITDVPHEKDPLKAIAVCQDEDEFSKETGINIVDDKLNYKYHSSMVKKYEQLEKYLKPVLDKVNELKLLHQAYARMSDDELKKYM